MPLRPSSSTNSPQSQGFTYVEVLVAAMILSILFVAALRLSGNLARSHYHTISQDTASRLALDMIQEIKQKDYADPDNPDALGPDPGETAAGRSLFNDIDDYHRWEKSPPQDIQGNPLIQYPDITRSVNVTFVAPNNFNQTVNDNQGFKKISITIKQNETVLLEYDYVFSNVDWITQ